MVESKSTPPKSTSDRLVPILVLVTIAMAFGLGVMWQKVSSMQAKPATTNAVAEANPTTTTDTQPAGPQITSEVLDSLLTNEDVIVLGNKDSGTIFVEASDVSCPFCSIAAGLNPELNTGQFALASDGGTYVPPVPEIEKLVKSDDAAFVYMYFPGHGSGEMTAKALFCAHEEGKFWEVHDKLMTGEGYDLANDVVANDKAKSGELAAFLAPVFNQTKMKECLDSGKFDSRVKDNVSLAQSLGISGTPFFAVNTATFPGAYSYTDMESAIASAK